MQKLKIGRMVKTEDLIYKTDKYVYNFRQYKTKRSFSKNNFAGKTTSDNVDKDQNDLLSDFIDFKKGKKLRDIEKKKLERDLSDKINWNRSDKYIAIHGKI